MSKTTSACFSVDKRCRIDSDCPPQTACINRECLDPCREISPCGIKAICKVLDTEPVRTMTCICPPGYIGNAAVECVPGMSLTKTNILNWNSLKRSILIYHFLNHYWSILSFQIRFFWLIHDCMNALACWFKKFEHFCVSIINGMQIATLTSFPIIDLYQFFSIM